MQKRGAIREQVAENRSDTQGEALRLSAANSGMNTGDLYDSFREGMSPICINQRLGCPTSLDVVKRRDFDISPPFSGFQDGRESSLRLNIWSLDVGDPMRLDI